MNLAHSCIADGVEGLVHISESRRARPQPPSDVLRAGQIVKAQPAITRQAPDKLSMKQLIPRNHEYTPNTGWRTNLSVA